MDEKICDVSCGQLKIPQLHLNQFLSNRSSQKYISKKSFKTLLTYHVGKTNKFAQTLTDYFENSLMTLKARIRKEVRYVKIRLVMFKHLDCQDVSQLKRVVSFLRTCGFQ